MNEEKKLDSQRRTFFGKFVLGALVAGIASAMPLKNFISKKKTETTNSAVSVEINPLAVKREKNGSALLQREQA